MSELKYKIITNQNQYEKYCEIHESLSNSRKKSEKEEMELIELLIHDYNERQTEGYLKDQTPVEILKELMEENQITQRELSRRIEVSPQLINDILKYRREITKNIAYKLAIEFALKPVVFFKQYKLQGAT